jgi:IS5 family transposase
MLGGLTWTQRSTQLLLTARLRNWVLPSRRYRGCDGQRVEVRSGRIGKDHVIDLASLGGRP